ncbi:MAG: methyltransferase [Zhengella sp.]|uniref:tRNA1(Val) (adenine(37)-N6)-methyltransferase n=1 Tax=Zhengella sp. TaxID=2282762 RepID=UPI0035284EE9
MTAESLATDFTLDAFHRGDFWLKQPARRGHRAGMDAMMLAAALPSGFAGRIADLGAGAGAAGLAAVSRCREARTVLFERSAEMAGFARQTLALAQNAWLADRAAVIQADVTLRGPARAKAGLADNGFEAVLMNPPFNAGHDRQTPDGLKAEAHVMADGLLEAWIRTAAAITRTRGLIALIVRPDAIGPALDALEGRFGGLEIKPIHPRDDTAAIRIVIRGVRASRKRLVFAPPLFLHESGSDLFSAGADAINNGRASLFGD